MPPVKKSSPRMPAAKICDRNGRLSTSTSMTSRARQPVPSAGIACLIDATVATEDASYWDNPGVNMKGLVRAAYENFFPGRLASFRDPAAR
jgi:membrane peptidoglycan carboxypeptidase